MKPTDKESKSIESTLTSEKPSMQSRLQAALWHVMNMFHIPDVDLLEQVYDSATVRLVRTTQKVQQSGVAQGSITSQQLFNIFINALLRWLTATG